LNLNPVSRIERLPWMKDDDACGAGGGVTDFLAGHSEKEYLIR